MRQHFGTFLIGCAVMISALLLARVGEAQGLGVLQPQSAFREGSHLNYVRDVAQAQAAAYSKVLHSYDEHLEAEPRDAIAGVEKCLFIDQFADAEDNSVEAALEDQEKCVADLESVPLVNHAEAQLYLLDRKFGQEAISAAEDDVGDSASWPAPLRARLHEKLAFLYEEQDLDKAGSHALLSVQLDPQSKARLIAASWLSSIGANTRVRALVSSTPENAWEHLSVYDAADVLIKVGDATAAANLLRSHVQQPDATNRQMALARAVAESGQIGIARQLYSSALAAPDRTLSARDLQDLFLFERNSGSLRQALTAYQRLRDKGYYADPFGYYRLSLVERYPTASWRWRDTAGPLALAVLLTVVALMPVMLIAPVHYRGLVHQVRGTLPPAPPQYWGLSHAWYVLAGLLVAGVLAYFFCAYPGFEAVLGEPFATGRNVDQRALGRALIWQTVLFALLAMPLLRKVDIRATLLGTWSWHRSVLTGTGCAVLARILLVLGAGVVHAVWPAAAFGSDLVQGLQGIHVEYGTWAVLIVAVVAIPILEEIAFRGVILTALRRYVSFWPAALAQALAFAALHEELSFFVFFAAFGLGAALLARRSEGLLASIAMHMTYNLLAVITILGTIQRINAA